uniref:Mitogenactivated protein kinase kinase putative n=1 Tax=Albugo laibachii Nc14 TaxID=890382 RepID=F0WTF1_9STRA|nr:mitogenactivated protein kinase kinase putative [Albugo laibachii Nc14]|eukprot:CCA24641.1 mitogenactivated protein kinase kinase putative [Albugo laibachii Nc14]
MSVLQGRTQVHPRINLSNEALFGSAPTPELAHKKLPAQLHKKKNIHLQLDMIEPRTQENTCYWQEHPTFQLSDEYDSATKQLDLYISCGTTIAQVVNLVARTDIRDKQLLSTVSEKVSSTAKLTSGKNAHFEDGVLFDGPADIGKDTKRISDLGSGASGFVSLALYLPLLKLVAVKEITVHNAQERQMVKNELHALHSNLSRMDTTSFQSRIHRFVHAGRELSTYHSRGDSSPFLVSFYGAYLTPSRSSISIVMEFMDMGSVQNMLDQPNGFILSEDLIRHVAFCCVHALQHMHSKW